MPPCASRARCAATAAPSCEAGGPCSAAGRSLEPSRGGCQEGKEPAESELMDRAWNIPTATHLQERRGQAGLLRPPSSRVCLPGTTTFTAVARAVPSLARAGATPFGAWGRSGEMDSGVRRCCCFGWAPTCPLRVCLSLSSVLLFPRLSAQPSVHSSLSFPPSGLPPHPQLRSQGSHFVHLLVTDPGSF